LFFLHGGFHNENQPRFEKTHGKIRKNKSPFSVEKIEKWIRKKLAKPGAQLGLVALLKR